jgi:hypothetical protein
MHDEQKQRRQNNGTLFEVSGNGKERKEKGKEGEKGEMCPIRSNTHDNARATLRGSVFSFRTDQTLTGAALTGRTR